VASHHLSLKIVTDITIDVSSYHHKSIYKDGWYITLKSICRHSW